MPALSRGRSKVPLLGDSNVVSLSGHDGVIVRVVRSGITVRGGRARGVTGSTRTKIRPLKSEARLLMGFRPKARNIEGAGVAAVIRLRPSHSLDLGPVAGSEVPLLHVNQPTTARIGQME